MATRAIQYLVKVRGSDAFGSVASGAASAAKGVAVVTAAAVAASAAMFKLSQASADVVNTLNDTAARTGLASDTIAGIQLAAEGSGESLQGMDRVLRGFITKIEQTGDTTKTMDQHLRDALGTIQALPSPTEKALKAVELFGSQGGKLMQVFGDTSLDQFIERAEYLGSTVSPEATAAAAKWQRQMADLKAMVRGVQIELMAAFGGDLLSVIESFGQALLKIRDNADAIRAALMPVAKGFVFLTGVAVAFGDALLETLKLSGKAVKEFAKAYWDTITSLGSARFDGLQEVSNELGKLSSNFHEGIASAAASALKLGLETGATDAMPEIGATIAKAIEEGSGSGFGNGRAPSAYSGNAFGGLEGEDHGVIDTSAASLQHAGRGNSAGGQIGDLAGQIGGALMAVAGPVGAAVGAALNLDSTLQSITDAVTRLPEVLKRLPEMIRGLLTAVFSVVRQLPKIAMDLIRALPGLISDAVKGIVELIKDLPKIIKELIKELPQMLTDMLGDSDFIFDLIVGLKVALLELAWFVVVQLPIEMIKMIPKIVKAMIDGIAGFFADVWQSIKDFFKNLFNPFSGSNKGTGSGTMSIYDALGDSQIQSIVGQRGTGGSSSGHTAGGSGHMERSTSSTGGPSIQLHVGTLIADDGGIERLMDKMRNAIAQRGVPGLS